MEIKTYVAGPFMTNTYLIINDKKGIIVDPTIGLEKYIDDIKKINITAILLTHCHIDHIASAHLFDAPIYMSKIDAINIKDNRINLSNTFGIPFIFPSNNIIGLDDEVLSLNNLKIECILTPGHTSGGMCFLINDSLFSGDTLFQVGIGRTDFPTGNMNDLKKSLLKLKCLPKNTKIYPGHGELSTVEFELKYNHYLK